jgi:hypothetical protein
LDAFQIFDSSDYFDKFEGTLNCEDNGKNDDKADFKIGNFYYLFALENVLQNVSNIIKGK